MRNKQANSIPFQALFLLMIFVSIMLDTRIGLPFGTILRWVMPIMLLLAVIWAANGRVQVSGNLLYWLLIVIFGVTVFISPQLVYSSQRYISFLLITLTFMMYFFFIKKQGALYDSAQVFGWLYIAYGILNFVFLQWSADRPTGLTANANSLGHFSNISFLFALLFYKKAERMAMRWGMLAVMVMSAVLVIMSASRSATIVLMINLIVAVWLIGTQRQRILICVISPAIIMLLLFNPEVLAKIPGFERMIEYDGIGSSREAVWEHGVNLVRQKPWFGWGYGISISLNIIETLSFHNSYLTVAIECGMIGLFAVILFVLYIVIKGLASYHKNKRIETFLLLMLVLNKVIEFIGESSMTSVGSAEGFFFWGVMMWLLVESSEKIPVKHRAG